MCIRDRFATARVLISAPRAAAAGLTIGLADTDPYPIQLPSRPLRTLIALGSAARDPSDVAAIAAIVDIPFDSTRSREAHSRLSRSGVELGRVTGKTTSSTGLPEREVFRSWQLEELMTGNQYQECNISFPLRKFSQHIFPVAK